ncbi:MAG: hypothetical protein IT578_02165 [Verrucomicrobiae bacterium]|nr:hypothetical protein [Verrucomicrobiae bacterium]
MKRLSACALVCLISALGVRATEPSAAPSRESLTEEIRRLDAEIERLNDRLLMTPSREVALRQPIERDLRSKQRALAEKQRVLDALAAPPSAAIGSGLRPIAKLFKEGKDSEGLVRWRSWLTSKEAPKDLSPDGLRGPAEQIAAQVSEDAKVRDALVRKLLGATPKPAKE